MPQVTVRIFSQTGQGAQVLSRDPDPATTLAVFLAGLAQEAGLGKDFAGHAVLLNGQSASRNVWDERLLEQGDVISIIPMLVGG